MKSTRRTRWLPLLGGVLILIIASVTYAQNLDQPFPARTIGELVNQLFRFGIVLIVLAAAIYIAIGAYMYFIAAGNAEMAKTGKEYITRSLMGLILGLLAWVILNTISPQFAKELRDPQPGAVRGTTADPAFPGDAAARR
ncbi:MAG: hypothetical protein G01um101438_628 [Parcubacteria group bacterium Gr01-1014_38]|nr:MAG: hypothetical protein G01um101438_628 [Parcubacteria group bacterium Gr01-1014_38]